MNSISGSGYDDKRPFYTSHFFTFKLYLYDAKRTDPRVKNSPKTVFRLHLMLSNLKKPNYLGIFGVAPT